MRISEAAAVLGVSPNCDFEEVRKSYRSLALKYHPDKCKTLSKDEATHEFQQISRAFQVMNAYHKDGKMDPETDEDFEFGGFPDEDVFAFQEIFMEVFGRAKFGFAGAGFSPFGFPGGYAHFECEVNDSFSDEYDDDEDDDDDDWEDEEDEREEQFHDFLNAYMAAQMFGGRPPFFPGGRGGHFHMEESDDEYYDSDEEYMEDVFGHCSCSCPHSHGRPSRPGAAAAAKAAAARDEKKAEAQRLKNRKKRERQKKSKQAKADAAKAAAAETSTDKAVPEPSASAAQSSQAPKSQAQPKAEKMTKEKSANVGKDENQPPTKQNQPPTKQNQPPTKQNEPPKAEKDEDNQAKKKNKKKNKKKTKTEDNIPQPSAVPTPRPARAFSVSEEEQEEDDGWWEKQSFVGNKQMKSAIDGVSDRYNRDGGVGWSEERLEDEALKSYLDELFASDKMPKGMYDMLQAKLKSKAQVKDQQPRKARVVGGRRR